MHIIDFNLKPSRERTSGRRKNFCLDTFSFKLPPFKNIYGSYQLLSWAMSQRKVSLLMKDVPDRNRPPGMRMDPRVSYDDGCHGGNGNGTIVDGTGSISSAEPVVRSLRARAHRQPQY